MSNDNENIPVERVEVEPYKLSEIFSIVPEYDGNPIVLSTFIHSCDTAYRMAIGDQKVLVTLHFKNKLRGRAAELINSRNPNTWGDIKALLETHFGDQRDLSSLIADLQRIRQLTNESPLTFVSRLQSHHAKMLSAINRQIITRDQKVAQSNLIDTMVLNTLLTGLEPRLGQTVRASYPPDILTAITRIKRELQLSYFQDQKSQLSRNSNSTNRKTTTNNFPKNCSYCHKNGHTISECRARQYSQTQQTIHRNFNPQFHNSNIPPFHNTTQPPRQIPNGQFQNRPSAIRPNPNHQRPSAIQPNPNYQRPPQNTGPQRNSNTPNHFQHSRAHHINLNNFENYSEYYSEQPDHYSEIENFQSPLESEYYQEFPRDNNSHYEQLPVPSENSELDFHQPQKEEKPPYNLPDQIMPSLESQVRTLNLQDSFDPTLNFSEQQFL